ncbi:DNA-binding domain superfamily [Sesbania bispinosa]|nr:DNA-binding domain superfamily [Sesbania bispinosa]
MAKEDRHREKVMIKSKPKFVGVRQRASGKWAAEIKDTSKKIRMWLGKSLFSVAQNQVPDNPYEADMNMISCSMGVTPNSSQFDYSWPLPLPQQMINGLPLPKDGFNEERQFSASVYAMNECYMEDTYGSKYEYDANYPFSHLFCFT